MERELSKNPIFIIPSDSVNEDDNPHEEGGVNDNGGNFTTIINNYYNFTPMNEIEISEKVVGLLRPFLKGNKAISKITSEIKEATNTSILEMWEAIKPIFIEEFEEDGELSIDVENSGIVAREIRKNLKNNNLPKSDLERIIRSMDSNSSGGLTVIGNGNIAVGEIKDNKGKIKIGKDIS